jgi:hypothetical protein
MKDQQQHLEKNKKVEETGKHLRQLHLCITNTANPFTVVEHETAVENHTKQCQSFHPFPTTLKLTQASTDLFPYRSRLPSLYRRHTLHILPHPHPNRHSQESEPVLPAKGASLFPPPQQQHHPLSRHPVVEVNLPPHLNFSSPHCCAHIPLPIHGLKPCSFSNPMPNRTIIGV